jgi:uncharacterized Tic20 family protein
MNLEALLAIGIFTLILGLILIVPGLWWARRKAKRLPDNANGKKKVTLFGVFYYGVFILFLLVATSLRYISPEISRIENVGFIILVIVIGVLGEMLAYKMGYKTISNSNDDVNA